MALQIWLPLNKNTENYGLGNVNVSNGDRITYDINGKFNGCYQFQNKIISIGSLEIGDEFTVCFWSKYNSLDYPRTHVGIQHSAGAYTGTNKGWDIGHGPTSGTSIEFDINDGTHTQRMALTGNGLSTLNVWTHFCVICSLLERKVKLYVNGNFSCEIEISNTMESFKVDRQTNIGGLYGWYFDGYLNDLRIYDHCLTEDDVKRLCQIKVLDLVPYKDEIRGGILFDRSGYCFSAVTPYNLTYKQSCIQLNGSSSSIKIPPLSAMNSGGVFTMNAWFLRKEFGTSRWETLFGGPSGFELETKPAASAITALVAYSWGGNSTSKYIPYELNKWVMVTMTRTTSNSKFYINGELKYTGSAGSIPSGEYFIGSWKIYNSQNMKANISNFQIFKKEFTVDEIVELYEKEKEMFLPDDYEELEYVESHGTEYIDTNVNFMYGDEFYFEYMQVQSASSENKGYGAGDVLANNITGGGRKYTSTSNVELYVTQSNLTFSPSIPYTSSLNKKYVEHWIIKNNVISVTLTDLQTGQKSTAQKSNIKSTYNSGNSVYLWRDHSNTYAYYSKTKIYRVWLKRENGVYALYLVPVRRRNDGEIGMYDLVTRQFLTNAGTGTFTGA